jgi:hypothetical protein
MPTRTQRDARGLIEQLQTLLKTVSETIWRSREVITRLDSTNPPKRPPQAQPEP